MQNVRGVFLAEEELPPAAWKFFIKISQAEGFTPQEYLKRLILQDIATYRQRKKPVLERAIEAGISYLAGDNLLKGFEKL